MDPISNHASGVSLNRRCTDFSVRNMVVSVAKNPTQNGNLSLKSANPRRVFGSLKLAASMPWIPRKSWMQRGKINDSKGIPGMKNHFSGLESLLSERSKKGLLIFHLRKPPPYQFSNHPIYSRLPFKNASWTFTPKHATSPVLDISTPRRGSEFFRRPKENIGHLHAT